MNRVATMPLQRTLSDAIQRAQQQLAASQAQLDTGKKAVDLAQLGTQAVRNLSARSLASAAAQAQVAAAGQIGTTMALYDTSVSGIETVAADLHQSILSSIGTDDGTGLQSVMESAFDQFRSILNTTSEGEPLFGGSQTAAPFTPAKLADAAGRTDADAFTNDDVRAAAPIADGVVVQYGITASDVGTDLFAAFRTLAEAGTIGAQPTQTQTDALKTALGQIDTALGSIRAVNAANGRRQSQVEDLSTRAQQRAQVLDGIISNNEDADYGQVAIDIAQQQSVLQVSYSVFGKLAGLSLVNYL